MDLFEEYELGLVKEKTPYRRIIAIEKEEKKLETRKKRRKLRLLDKQFVKLLLFTNR